MKKLCLILFALVPFLLDAQIFSTISNRSNGSVLGALSNPANMRTDSLFTWDANLFSVGFWGGGSSASMSIKDVAHFSNNFLRENILGIHGLSSGGGGIDITGPSVTFKISKTSSLGIGTRVRMFSNFWNVDGRLVSEIGEDIKEPQNYPYSLYPNKNMQLNAAMFSDINISYAKVLMQKGPHLLKGGITVKYISGMSQTSIDVQGLSGTVGEVTSSSTPYLTNASGNIVTKTSGSFFDDIKLGSITNALIGKGGVGADIGFVYDYRPTTWSAKSAAYKFRIGMSITDIGKISFPPDTAHSGSYNVHISTNNALYFNNNFNNTSFSYTSETFDKYPALFTRTATQINNYKIGLPTTLRVFMDVNFNNGFFASGDANIGLQKQASVTAMYVYKTIAFTPRYERNNFIISMPFIYQGYTHVSAGLGINVGPFYMGSGSLLSGIFSKTKLLDGFIGLRIDPDKKKNKTLLPSSFDKFTVINNDKESKNSQPFQPYKYKSISELFKSSLELQAIAATPNVVPFWMRSNQYGSVPLDGLSVSAIGQAVKEYDVTRVHKLDWAAGAELRLNGGRSAQATLIEGYAKVRSGIFEFKAGRSKQIMGLVDSTLSSGAFSMSGNALGIPNVQLAVKEYQTLPFWNGFLALKGNFMFGWLGNVPLYPNTAGVDSGRTLINNAETFFHQKSLYGRFGKPGSKFKFFAGFNHNVFYGSESKILKDFNLTPFQSFLYVVKGKTWTSVRGYETKLGNQLGSVDLGFSYEFKNISLFVYRQSFYDVGALFKLANAADGLNGIRFENKRKVNGNVFWKKILLEVFFSKNQAGELWSKPTTSGAENYYNHYMYLQGWSYNGIALGNPFITAKNMARAGLPSSDYNYFNNNRVLAFHLATEIKIKDFDCTGKLSWSKNWGTYDNNIDGRLTTSGRSVNPPPYFPIVNQFSAYFSANKKIASNMQIGATAAFDVGKLLYNSAGLMVSLKKYF